VPCYRPLRGFRARCINKTGKRSIVWNARDAIYDGARGFSEVTLPCGQCIHCRLERSRQWAIRCMHEAALHTTNSFITLTYADEHLPAHGSLDYEAPVLFMKRLRDHLAPHKVRSYGCAEYGELLSRPHYHLCIFGFDFPDRSLLKSSSDSKFSLFRSPLLESLWTLGHSSVAALTFESAAYVARYVVKKITGPSAPDHYTPRPLHPPGLIPSSSGNPHPGRIPSLLPEKAICVSRRPGLGKPWFDKYGTYVKHHDEVVLRGRKMRPPKYYDRLFDLADPAAFAFTKAIRKQGGLKAAAKLAEEDERIRVSRAPEKPLAELRLHVMERHQDLSTKLLKRGFENGSS